MSIRNSSIVNRLLPALLALTPFCSLALFFQSLLTSGDPGFPWRLFRQQTSIHSLPLLGTESTLVALAIPYVRPQNNVQLLQLTCFYHFLLRIIPCNEYESIFLGPLPLSTANNCSITDAVHHLTRHALTCAVTDSAAADVVDLFLHQIL